MLSECRESGLSVGQFCRDRDISPGLLYKWRKRLSKASRREDADFVELIGGAPAATCSSGVRIRLGVDTTICLERGFDPQTLQEVLGALGHGNRPLR